eukprot:gene12553-2292_t
MGDNTADLVYLAKLSEQADQYNQMVAYMRQLVKAKADLSRSHHRVCWTFRRPPTTRGQAAHFGWVRLLSDPRPKRCCHSGVPTSPILTCTVCGCPYLVDERNLLSVAYKNANGVQRCAPAPSTPATTTLDRTAAAAMHHPVDAILGTICPAPVGVRCLALFPSASCPHQQSAYRILSAIEAKEQERGNAHHVSLIQEYAPPRQPTRAHPARCDPKPAACAPLHLCAPAPIPARTCCHPATSLGMKHGPISTPSDVLDAHPMPCSRPMCLSMRP